MLTNGPRSASSLLDRQTIVFLLRKHYQALAETPKECDLVILQYINSMERCSVSCLKFNASSFFPKKCLTCPVFLIGKLMWFLPLHLHFTMLDELLYGFLMGLFLCIEWLRY